MTIAVTGATGFLGTALVNDLLQQKQAVRILARDAHKARTQFGESVEIVQGEIHQKEKLRQLVAGAEIVYHLAGRLYHPSTPAELYYQTHVEGTRAMLAACAEETHLQRFVHCSTTGVHGVTGPKPTAEDGPIAPTNPYEATKLEGERLALKAWQENALPVSIIRPGLVYGPGDLHLSGLFKSIQKDLFRVIGGGRSYLHPVYIDDMIAAFRLCATRPEAIGRSYNIAGSHPVTFQHLARGIAEAQGKHLPTGSIPLWLANLAADIFDLIPGVDKEKLPLTRSRVAFLTSSRIYDISRARAELGYEPVIELDEGLKRTANWYMQNHYL